MPTKYTAYFKVQLYYDGEPHYECGFYPADSFAEAVRAIEEYFADELVAIKHLELHDVGLVTMDEEIAHEVLRYNCI